MGRHSLLAVLLLAMAAIPAAPQTYIGFDKNGYPGDGLLPALHQTFAFTGYWLNNPPGMSRNPWAGKRSVVRAAGFGFLILFNGRLDAELKNRDAAALGRQDAAAAIAAAEADGFPRGAVIFLDQEEGGSLLPEAATYLGAWISTVKHSPNKPGVYCSGVPVPSGPKMISTAEDIATRFPGRKLWIWNDQCPPSPGCVVPGKELNMKNSGFPSALVWQYARSPLDPETAAACRSTFATDSKCYAPGLPHSEAAHIDLDASASPDPSHGR
jgi:hypothetical protein